MVCLYAEAYGQILLETNPTNIRWQQVNTSRFRVIYPRGFDQQGQRVANTLQHIYKAESASLGTEPRKITVILQNRSSTSNAFVSILPRRSEFYTMPPQDYNFLGTNDWLDMLATHEFRHVVQYQHATRGFNRLFYYLFGSTTLAAMSQAAAPQWFWEGDAVVTETAFTHSGRGRIPNFGLVFRTNLLEGRTFNYHKQYLRSYKNNIPDHYVLGYHMVSYLRRKTGDPEIWGKITARAWSLPFVPFIFSSAIHRETGLHVIDLYKDMAANLRQEWQEEIDQLKISAYESVNVRKSNTYTDYLYPQAMEDGSVLVMKKGIGDIEQFVTIKNGVEHKEFTPGFINDTGMLSASGSKVVWNEYGYDPRWGVRNYSRVKIYDIATGMVRVLGSRHDRLSSAALSKDGRRVVTVRSGNDYSIHVLILDAVTGKEVKTFQNPGNNFYSMPRWSDDGKKIVLLKKNSTGKAVSLLDVESGTITDILPASQENVGYPMLYGQWLFFNSPISGIDNLYALNLETKVRYQVTSSKYAAYNPSVSNDGKTIYYNEQSRNGLDVVKVPLDQSHWTPFDEASIPDSRPLYQDMAAQEGRPGLLDSIPDVNLPIKKYSKLGGIINPYSWGAYVSNDLTQINVGVGSRDILSTTNITAGYVYDLNEGSSLWKAGMSYQGLYPIIDISAQTGDRKTTDTGFGNTTTFKWKELTLEGGLRLPLVLTNSKYSRNLTIGNAAGLTRTSKFENSVTQNDKLVYQGPQRITPAYDTLVFVYKDQLNNGDLLYNRATLSFYNLLKRSRRDFLSKWGQTFDAELFSTPYGGDFNGQLLALRSTFYFPGLAKHHFFYTRLAYQDILQGPETNVYTFRNRIPKPRGHSYPSDGKFVSLSANYALPLWYPDIALGPMLNVQRIKANVFYDYGRGEGRVYFYSQDAKRTYFSITDQVYQSVGVETTFDFNVMRFLPKFELGLRTTYRFSNDFASSGVVFEFVIGNIGF